MDVEKDQGRMRRGIKDGCHEDQLSVVAAQVGAAIVLDTLSTLMQQSVCIELYS